MNKQNLFKIIAFLYCMPLAMGSVLVANEQQEIQFAQERRANDERYLLSSLCEANNAAKPAYIEPKIVKLVHNHDMKFELPYEGKLQPIPYQRFLNVDELAWRNGIPSVLWCSPIRHEVTTLNPDGTHTTLLSVYPQCSTRFSGSTWSAQCDNGLYTAHNVLQASVEPECPCGSYSYSCTWRKLWDMRHAISKRQRKAHCNVYDLQERAATTESLIQTEQDATAKEKYSQLLQLAKTGIKACIAWYQNPGRGKREWNQERRACNEACNAFCYNKKWIGGSYWKEMEERNHE